VILEDIKNWDDRLIQALMRELDVEDCLTLMKKDSGIRDRFLPNVKMTTRMWLTEEMQKRPEVTDPLWAETERRVFQLMEKVVKNS